MYEYLIDSVIYVRGIASAMTRNNSGRLATGIIVSERNIIGNLTRLNTIIIWDGSFTLNDNNTPKVDERKVATAIDIISSRGLEGGIGTNMNASIITGTAEMTPYKKLLNVFPRAIPV